VKNFDFFYSGEQIGKLYVSTALKKQAIRIGPPVEMKKHASRFKAQHSSTFVKNKRLHARLPVSKDSKAFLDSWKIGNKKMMAQMHIVSMSIE